jgi:hypothetical protein
MSQITIDLPADVAERAQAVAARTHQSVETVLVEWLHRAATDVPLAWLPDAEILALCDLQMGTVEQAEMSELLASQREGMLTNAERDRLHAILDQYRSGMLKKSQAVQIAVERGLRPAPRP